MTTKGPLCGISDVKSEREGDKGDGTSAFYFPILCMVCPQLTSAS